MSQEAIDILIPALCGASLVSSFCAGFCFSYIRSLRRRVRRLEVRVFMLQRLVSSVEYLGDEDSVEDQEQ